MTETVDCWVVRDSDGDLRPPWHYGGYPRMCETNTQSEVVVWSWEVATDA